MPCPTRWNMIYSALLWKLILLFTNSLYMESLVIAQFGCNVVSCLSQCRDGCSAWCWLIQPYPNPIRPGYYLSLEFIFHILPTSFFHSFTQQAVFLHPPFLSPHENQTTKKVVTRITQSVLTFTQLYLTKMSNFELLFKWLDIKLKLHILALPQITSLMPKWDRDRLHAL